MRCPSRSPTSDFGWGDGGVNACVHAGADFSENRALLSIFQYNRHRYFKYVYIWYSHTNSRPSQLLVLVPRPRSSRDGRRGRWQRLAWRELNIRAFVDLVAPDDVCFARPCVLRPSLRLKPVTGRDNRAIRRHSRLKRGANLARPKLPSLPLMAMLFHSPLQTFSLSVKPPEPLSW